MDSAKAMEKGIPQVSGNEKRKGGIRTLPFIIANEALEKVPSYALVPSLVKYLNGSYHMHIAGVQNLMNYWLASSHFAPVLIAFLADSYLGRFAAIGLGSIFSLLGQAIVWLTTILPQTRPPPCAPSAPNCQSATTGQMAILIAALAFKAVGAGGIRPCSMPFGADQLANKSERVLESYFSWYYAAASLSAVLGLTVVVYIINSCGWTVGYGVSAMLMLLATVAFYIASPLYVKRKASSSLFTGFAQFLSAAYKNRNLPFPSSRSGYHHGKESEITTPSEKLKFLNKACIIRNPEQDIGPDGLALDPWSLCTVQQVEELKALFKVMPIWSTTIMMSITGSQQTFAVLQASTVNRKIFGGFSIPETSMSVFIYATIVIWVSLYERVLIPLASKIKGKQVYIGVRWRMGMGLLLSAISMALTAAFEGVRRRKAIQQGLLHNPHATVDMSVKLLFPQYIVMGLCESFSTLGQLEFYHREFPKTMKSIGNSLFFLSLGTSYLLNNALFNIVDWATSRAGKTSWVADNLNEARFDNYYWLFCGLSVANLIYYIFCSRSYGNTAEVTADEFDSEEE